MKIKVKIGVFIVLLLLVYAYLAIFGLKISIPRKEMAKSIPLFGENVYTEECTAERKTLVLSVEMGLGHTATARRQDPYHNDIYIDTSKDDNTANGSGAKCFAEIHNNGWIKIFYCTYKEDEHSIISNYDYIGRKFLITPWRYYNIMKMAKQVENESDTAEQIIDASKAHWYYDGIKYYPEEYSYGVAKMPTGWEESNSSLGRIFYNNHWYMGNTVTEPLINEFRENNNWIAKQLKRERDEIGYAMGWQ